MLLPIAMIVAVRAVENQFESARPHAPVVEETTPPLRRTRSAVARVLYATARAVAPAPAPVRCLPTAS